MRCPRCGKNNDRVTESRAARDYVRRRRECRSCGERFTTREFPEVLTSDRPRKFSFGKGRERR